MKHHPGKPRPHVSPGQIFDRMVLSARRSESEHVRENAVHPSASRPRVPCNARLKRRRSPQNLFCACFGFPGRDRAGLASCSGSSGLDLYEPAGIGGFTGRKTARPAPIPFPTKPRINPGPNEIPIRTIPRCTKLRPNPHLFPLKSITSGIFIERGGYSYFSH